MTHKIILIDDDNLTNYINRSILLRCLPDAETEDFSDTFKAIHYMEQQAESPEAEFLIFLDINMPDLTGWEVLDAIERGFPHLNAKVVMLTSSIDQSDRAKAFTWKRVISFYSKPLDRAKVSEITDLLEASRTTDKAGEQDLLEA